MWIGTEGQLCEMGPRGWMPQSCEDQMGNGRAERIMSKLSLSFYG